MKIKYSFVALAIVVGFLLNSCGEDSATEPNNEAPSCYFSSPPINSVFDINTDVIIKIVASDWDGSINNVKIYVNSIPFDTLFTSPYYVTINTSKYELGDIILKATASDNNGKETTAERIIRIETDYFIELNSPNGGATIQTGASQIINWNSNLPEYVKIDLYKNNVFYSNIIESTMNDGIYSWAVPSTLESSNDYKVKICGVFSNNVNDISNSSFALTSPSENPYILITSPNGSENWVLASTKDIKWDSNFADDVVLELLRNDTLVSIIDDQAQNAGSFTWNLPNSLGAGNDYKIRIKRVIDDAIKDVSDENINLGHIILTSPNGGEYIKCGSSITSYLSINWLSSSFISTSTVDINLYKDDILYKSIVKFTNNTGSYSFKIPSDYIDSENYKIVISIPSNPEILDVSNSYFEIENIAYPKIIGSTSDYANRGSTLTNDGGIVLAGIVGSSDVLIKLDSLGIKKWENINYAGWSRSSLSAVAQKTNGNIIAVGSRPDSSTDWAFWELETNSSGNEITDDVYSGHWERWETGYSVQATSDGGKISLGNYYDYVSEDEEILYLNLIKEGGSNYFSKTFREEGSNIGYSVQQTPDGGYIVACLLGNLPSLVRFDTNGNKLWQQSYDCNRISYVQNSIDGGFVIVGSELTTGYSLDLLLIKTDSFGNFQWEKTYGGSNYEYGNYLATTDDGGYILAGSTESYGLGLKDIWVIKTDSNGNRIWDKTFGGRDSDEAIFVSQLNNGQYIITGNTDSYSDSQDMIVIKTDSYGNIIE